MQKKIVELDLGIFLKDFADTEIDFYRFPGNFTPEATPPGCLISAMADIFISKSPYTARGIEQNLLLDKMAQMVLYSQTDKLFVSN